MTFDVQLIGAHNAPLIGVAPLMRRAFAGEDLAPVGQVLLERAQAYPNDAHAYMDFSTVLQLTGNREDALAVQAEAIMLQPHYTIPARRDGGLTLLVLMGPGDLMSNTPVEFLVENSDVTLELLYLRADEDFPDDVPGHDVMLVAVAESEANQVLLKRLTEYTSEWPRPVINRPEQIRSLSRDGVCAALRGVQGVEMPVSVRTGLGALNAIASGALPIETLLPDGGFPIIVRPLGSHAGTNLQKIDTPAALGTYLKEVEGPQFYVSRFVDYRSEDKLFRKYRVALIEGKPFICHYAISQNWMIHYLNAGMTESADKRAEEAAAMASFDADFAQRHHAALQAIDQRMGLPYLGIDCAEMPNGDLLIFEVDNAMIVHAMDPEQMFPYKLPAMQKVFGAFRELLERSRA
ncbi:MULTISPECIES: RimK family alpha-L-glutamate ligase [unclassified Duganella]|uniref:ATP-grasp domain-containing protein n=1 Tax=unclassified Duganella TaxID=2636909 RepID=UPI0008834A1C|nr:MULTISPECIES: RimK family alpha-L-glutamate ligase [unclassified Duganella]SDG81382.1 Glutathione synthase/RimK-type ligase, ATP-grasp superfamily [Duganella sp. OV458]SDK08755.1 Glutathione synthase/RimK-type ligase, ATP-grasp superfamily [Duganella sp. OV510]